MLTPADGNYRDVVEVTARTGQYEPAWHRLGVPTDLARLLSVEREKRALLFRGRTGLQTIVYLGFSYQGARPEDSMDQVYRDHRRTEAGTGYPVLPPKPKKTGSVQWDYEMKFGQIRKLNGDLWGKIMGLFGTSPPVHAGNVVVLERPSMPTPVTQT